MHHKMRFAVLAVFLLLIASFSAFIFIPNDWEWKERITNHIYDFNSLIVVLTVLTAFFSINQSDKKKYCWLLMSIGVAGWFLGDVTWTLMIYLGIDPMPSPADVFYMIGYLGVLSAVFMKFWHVRNSSSSKDIFNGVFVSLCLIAIISYTVLMPIIVSDDSLLNKVVFSFYPVADSMIILFAVIIISTMHVDKESFPWLWVCAGISLWIIADTLTAYFEWSGIETAINFVDMTFLAGLHAIGLGAFYRKLIGKGEIDIDSRKPSSFAATA